MNFIHLEMSSKYHNMDSRHLDIDSRHLEIDSKHLEIDPRIMRRVPVHGDALKPPGDRL